jgi:hypothetical protein
VCSFVDVFVCYGSFSSHSRGLADRQFGASANDECVLCVVSHEIALIGLCVRVQHCQQTSQVSARSLIVRLGIMFCSYVRACER